MQITLSNIDYQEENSRVMIDVTFYDETQTPHHSARVTVFVDMNDSYAELKRQAIQKARRFLMQAAAVH